METDTYRINRQVSDSDFYRIYSLMESVNLFVEKLKSLIKKKNVGDIWKLSVNNSRKRSYDSTDVLRGLIEVSD